MKRKIKKIPPATTIFDNHKTSPGAESLADLALFQVFFLQSSDANCLLIPSAHTPFSRIKRKYNTDLDSRMSTWVVLNRRVVSGFLMGQVCRCFRCLVVGKGSPEKNIISKKKTERIHTQQMQA